MPIRWDATWNRWRHLLGTKIELQGTLVQTGKYRHRNDQWELVKWETALPSRIHVKVPANIAEQIEAARRSYHRFGEFSDALGQIRSRIEREPWKGSSCAASVGTSVSLGTLISPKSPGSRITTSHTTASSAGGRDACSYTVMSTSSIPREGSPSRHRNWVTRHTCFPSPRVSKPSLMFTPPPRRRPSGRIEPTCRKGWDSWGASFTDPTHASGFVP